MIKKCFLLLFFPSFVFAQKDITIAIEKDFSSVFSFPFSQGKTESFSAEDLSSLGNLSFDENLAVLVSGANSVRTDGIYSYKTSLSLRGYPSSEQGRTLIAIDGVRANNSSTGGFNWNSLDAALIESVEILKGPASFIYGAQAMSGIINIKTKKKSSKAEVSIFAGTYDTYSQKAFFSDSGERISFFAGAAKMSSAGYEAAVYPDPYTDKKSLEEKNFYGSFDVQGKRLNFDSLFMAYSGYRTEGVKIYSDKGQNREYDNIFMKASVSQKGKCGFSSDSHYSKEFYQRENEYFKSLVYYFVKSDVLREDFSQSVNYKCENADGLSIYSAFQVLGANLAGRDFQKQPTLLKAYDRGKNYDVGQYVSLGFKPRKNINLLGGFRYDVLFYKDGYYANENPSFASVNGALKSSRKYFFSPAAQLDIEYFSGLSQYISFGYGFRAATLEDMSLSLLKGSKFLEANPNLKPEKNFSYETGFFYSPFSGFYFQPQFYVNVCEDFIYEVSKGTTVNINGIKPVYYKENVAKAVIRGLELPLRYSKSSVFLQANFAFFDSEVKSFFLNPSLEGKDLAYSPKRIFSFQSGFKKKHIELSVSSRYKSSYYTDDLNSFRVSSCWIHSFKTVFTPVKSFSAEFGVENVLDKRFLESELYKSPGRMFFAGITKRFK